MDQAVWTVAYLTSRFLLTRKNWFKEILFVQTGHKTWIPDRVLNVGYAGFKKKKLQIART